MDIPNLMSHNHNTFKNIPKTVKTYAHDTNMKTQKKYLIKLYQNSSSDLFQQ